MFLMFVIFLAICIGYFGIGFLVDNWVDRKLLSIDPHFYYTWYIVLDSFTIFFWPIALPIWITYIVRKGIKDVPRH